jgi:tRNA uridine 5-carboxymethylaminomethyl modification enzyme
LLQFVKGVGKGEREARVREEVEERKRRYKDVAPELEVEGL